MRRLMDGTDLVEEIIRQNGSQPEEAMPQPEDYNEYGVVIRALKRTSAELEALKTRRAGRGKPREQCEKLATVDELRWAATEGAKMSDEAWEHLMVEWTAKRRDYKPFEPYMEELPLRVGVPHHLKVEVAGQVHHVEKGVSRKGSPWCQIVIRVLSDELGHQQKIRIQSYDDIALQLCERREGDDLILRCVMKIVGGQNKYKAVEIL